MPATHLSAVPTSEEQESLLPAAGGTTAPPPPTAAPSKAPAKARAQHYLPTTRVKPEKQRQALGVYAQLTASTRGRATTEDLAVQCSLTTNTASLIHGFFQESGWITKAKRGEYVATEPTLEYYRQQQHGVTEEEVRHLLADAARQSWYWAPLESMVSSSGLPISQARYTLAREASANDHVEEINALLEWLEWLQLITITADVVHLVRRTLPSSTNQEVSVSDTTSPTGATPPLPPTPSAANGADAPVPGEKSIFRFVFEVDMTAEEASNLDEDRFKAIMEAVAAHRRS